jgi:hypothetical protein
MTGKSKYAALGRYLREHSNASLIPMSFAEIEQLTGVALPASKRYPAWWSNNPSNNPMTKVWLAAGFRTEQVDVAAGKLVFKNDAKEMREIGDITREFGLDFTRDATVHASEEPRDFRQNANKPVTRHPAIGALKGTFTIEPGWDLTRPSLDPEELAEWEASLERKADLAETGLSGKKQ